MKYLPTILIAAVAVTLLILAPGYAFGFCWLVANMLFKH